MEEVLNREKPMELIKLDQTYKDELLEVWKIAFEGDEEFGDELCTHFFNQADLWQYAYGWVEDNKLVSTYLSLDVKVFIRNQEFRGHYIDGLATLPSHRGKGLIHKQMLNDAKECLQSHIPIMLVDPSRDSFYRKFGFEFAIDQYRIGIDESFYSPTEYNSQYTVKADIIAGNRELQSAYKVMNEWFFKHARYNEMKWPKCYEDIKFKRNDITIAVAYDINKQPCGYMLYSIEDKRMFIESFRYVHMDGFYALKQYMMSLEKDIIEFIFNSIPEDFPIDLLTKDIVRPEKKLYFGSWISRMIRIVDFKGFLEGVIEKAPRNPICIHIVDDIVAENEGFYMILPSGKIEKYDSGVEDVTAAISDIVPLLTGLRSAKELYYKGKLKVNESGEIQQSYAVPSSINELDYILPKVTTFSADEYLAP